MRDLLKRALVALKTCDEFKFAGQMYMQYSKDAVEDCIAEIESALVEPEQQPVYFAYIWDDGELIGLSADRKLDLVNRNDAVEIQLYTKPPRQKPVYLSDDELLSYRSPGGIQQAVLKANGLIK